MRITLLNWNIKCGCDRGPLNNGWPRRKLALRAALGAERFDILSVQEGLPGQLNFLQDCLPGYERCGVGRTDGRSAGEHCAIFFSRKRYELIGSGDFWLSATPDKPSRSFDPPPLPPRICSWALLKDRKSALNFRVFNTHFPLAGPARTKSAKVLMAEMKKVHADAPVILSGDFNSRPGSVPCRLIEASGLTRAGNGAPRTWHLGGVGMVCLDGIFASPEWTVNAFRVVDTAIDGVHPSDHFGILAELEL